MDYKLTKQFTDAGFPQKELAKCSLLKEQRSLCPDAQRLLTPEQQRFLITDGDKMHK
jgi:hypothetical protein